MADSIWLEIVSEGKPGVEFKMKLHPLCMLPCVLICLWSVVPFEKNLPPLKPGPTYVKGLLSILTTSGEVV